MLELERLALERDLDAARHLRERCRRHLDDGLAFERRDARAPSAPAGRSPGSSRRRPRRARCRSRRRRSGAEARNALFASRSGTRSCGRLGPARRRLDRREVELDDLRVRRRVVRVVPERPAPCSTPRRARRARPAGRSAAGSGSSPRRPGRSRTSRRTPGTCSRSSRGRRAGESRGRGRSTRRTSRRRRVARRIWVTVSTRSVAVAPSGSAPMSLNPTTCGTSIEIASPSIAASASMPPTPQPSTPSPLIIVVCESVPTSVSGKATPFRVVHDAGQELEVHLVDDPRARGDDPEVGERALPPAEERVALAVALELELGVARDGEPRRVLVDLHRVVDDELGRQQRVDPLRVAAELAHRVAHRGEVDDRGDAGEVLEEHAPGRERDLLRGLGRRDPAATASTSAPVTVTPSSWRRTFSSRTRSVYGRRRTSKRSCSDSSRKISTSRSPTVSCDRAPKLSGWAMSPDSTSFDLPSRPRPRSVSDARRGSKWRTTACAYGRPTRSAYAANPSSRTGFRSSVYGVEDVLAADLARGVEEREPDPDRDLEQAPLLAVSLVDEGGVGRESSSPASEAPRRSREGRRATA